MESGGNDHAVAIALITAAAVLAAAVLTAITAQWRLRATLKEDRERLKLQLAHERDLSHKEELRSLLDEVSRNEAKTADMLLRLAAESGALYLQKKKWRQLLWLKRLVGDRDSLQNRAFEMVGTFGLLKLRLQGDHPVLVAHELLREKLNEFCGGIEFKGLLRNNANAMHQLNTLRDEYVRAYAIFLNEGHHAVGAAEGQRPGA
jgi:hypothetical protein